MKRSLPQSLDERRRHAGGALVPRVDGRPGGQLRARCPARAAGPRHRALRPRRHRPGVVGRLARAGRSAWRTGHLGGDGRLGAGGRLRRPRRRLRVPLPAQPQADPHRGRGPPPRGGRRRPVRRRARCSHPTEAAGTSSSARPTRPRRTAASSSKRVGEGYAAKRRRLGVPGGNRAPVRDHPRGQALDAARSTRSDGAVVRRAYELAAGGRTDWEVGAADRPRQDPRRRDPDQPDLRRASPDG